MAKRKEAINRAQTLDGKSLAASLRLIWTEEVEQLHADHGLTPRLDVVLVGDNPASQVYVNNKAKALEECGLHSRTHRLKAETSEADLLALIERLNNDLSVNGILVQLPLPEGISPLKVIDAIDPDKDIDGFHIINVGRLATGLPGLVPCTPRAIMHLIQSTGRDPAGLDAVVIGRSSIVGKPVAQLLIDASATVTVAHSRTRDMPAVARRADILIAAVGRPQMVRGDWIKDDAIVIDVGINRIPDPRKGPDKSILVGDVAFEEAAERAGFITPVPGGVGPLTIAYLIDNTITAACRQNGVARD